MRKKSFGKKVVTVVLACVMALGMTTAVFADELDTPVDDPVEPAPQIVGSLLASGADSFYGTGYIYVHLLSGNSYGDIEIGSDESEDAGGLFCFVVFPEGEIYTLGDILASGGYLDPIEFDYLPAGTYTFYFYSATDLRHSVYANIYD